MAVITLKNLPDTLYEKLKEQARRNHRSINSEAIACLEYTLTSQPVDPEEYLNEIRELRKKIKAPLLTEEVLHEAKNEGRL